MYLPATEPTPPEKGEEPDDVDDRPTQATRQTCQHNRRRTQDVRFSQRPSGQYFSTSVNPVNIDIMRSYWI